MVKKSDDGSSTFKPGRESSKPSGTTGRLGPTDPVSTETPSCPITVSDGQTPLKATGRCDDGSDDSIVSPSLAECAANRGIGKINAITPVRLQVALKSETEAQTFSFSRSWTAPRTVLHLASGQLALANVTFLVADGDLACEDLLINLPVLRHLQVDTRTLLENNRSVLDGADCSHVGNRTLLNSGGKVSRMMIARLNRTARDTVRYSFITSFRSATRVLRYSPHGRRSVPGSVATRPAGCRSA